MNTWTVVIDGQATSGLTLTEAYALWRTATGNADMVKDSDYNRAFPEQVGA